MKNQRFILSIILVILIASASVYGFYLATYSAPANNTPNGSETFTPITITDYRGENLTFSSPVTRIVCITGGFTELLCAMGAQDLIVGRDELSISPYSITSIPVVASSSSAPNLELILELEPQLVIADTMLKDKAEYLATLAEAGILVYIDKPSDYSRLMVCLEQMSKVLGLEENAVELEDFLMGYYNLVISRIATLDETEKRTVYVEWTDTWKTQSTTTGLV
jgi:iron complex transport system substrate-binding protein